MPEASTSKDGSDRVAAALRRVKSESVDHNTCLDYENDFVQTYGGNRNNYGVNVPWKSGQREPSEGTIYIPNTYLQDLSIHEVRRWFVWVGSNSSSLGGDHTKQVHPNALLDLNIKSHSEAVASQKEIREWYHNTYADLVDWVEQYFQELNEDDEECFHHWHIIEEVSLDIILDGDGEIDEVDFGGGNPNMRCCECDLTQTFEEITGRTLYDTSF